MRPRLVLVAALAAFTLVAGCFGKDRPDYAGIQEELNLSAAPFLLQEHGSDGDHFDAALHNGSFNMELLAYHNGVDETGDANRIPADGGYTEMAVTSEYAYLGRSSASGDYGGFSIVKLRDRPGDPVAPFKVGEFDALSAADIEVNDGETLAFLATQRNTPQQIAQGVASSQSPVGGLPRGIYVVNIEDKTTPTLASFVPLPVNGPHTITYFHHPNGSEYLAACTYDLVTDPGVGLVPGLATFAGTQRVLIFQVVDKPSVPDPLAGLTDSLAATLVPVAQFTIPEQAPMGRLFLPHDTQVQVHPTFDGGDNVLLYVAYWDKGLRILDITNLPQVSVPPGTAPPAPQLSELGFSTDFAPSKLNNIHFAKPFDEPIAGRHVTVTQPEIPQVDGETGQITFFDTSDPQAPAKMGHWTLPPGDQGQLSVSNFDFSPHNFDLWDGKVALAHFHAGVWVIDVHDERNLLEPKAVGYYMPHTPRQDSPDLAPEVWGVFEVDGLLYAIDEGTGLYVLRYTGP